MASTARALKVGRLGRRRRAARPIGGNAIEAIALLAGVVLWEVLGRSLGLPWLPPFSAVLEALGDLVRSGEIGTNLLESLRSLAIGFAIALVAGLFLGAMIGRYRRVEQALDIYVHALFVAPSMIFAPIFFAIFGLSGATRIAVIVMYTVFIIVMNTATAIRIVNPELVEMASSFGAKERQILVNVLFPAALPLIFAGVRLGMGRAVKGMINGEMFIALVGLGALAQRHGSQFDAPSTFAVAMVVLVVALVANWLVQALDRRLTGWSS